MHAFGLNLVFSCHYVGQIGTWLEISNWLMPNGRIMVNCGGTSGSSEADLKSKLINGINAVQNSTIKAMSKAFPGQVSLLFKNIDSLIVFCFG